MNSIRIRLFLILLGATGLVWLSAFFWIEKNTRAEVEQVLDARLEEAGQMVSSLIADHRIDVTRAAALLDGDGRDGSSFPAVYSHQLTCQIWSLDGVLVGQSGGAPRGRLGGPTPGFSENVVDGEVWRVYTVINEPLGMRIMVGDALRVRDRLVRDVLTGLILPALLILPVLALLIWASLRRGLRPLDRLAAALARRPARDLGPVALAPLPREIRPVGAALNGLFARVDAAREREKSFTSFAAHELKTPLAGIRTQAQIAAMAPDAETRERALRRIADGVTRSDRMVQQLLALARLDSAEPCVGSLLDAAQVAREVVAELRRSAEVKEVALCLAGPEAAPLSGDAVILSVALRNVIENAIAAAPVGTTVEVGLSRADDRLVIEVADRGAGIAAQDRVRITERFFHGSRGGGGSGLGLAIVKAAVNQLGGALSFAPRPGGGELVRMGFPLPG
ncbi:sensor histidine kinase [Sulfitobacter aestuarii]|uniref:histidine kinase n=1 Tax=Sulfitobacter aestuarii TaxID=2161676 RepID=A0ABW5U2U3_9RHOB